MDYIDFWNISFDYCHYSYYDDCCLYMNCSFHNYCNSKIMAFAFFITLTVIFQDYICRHFFFFALMSWQKVDCTNICCKTVATNLPFKHMIEAEKREFWLTQYLIASMLCPFGPAYMLKLIVIVIDVRSSNWPSHHESCPRVYSPQLWYFWERSQIEILYSLYLLHGLPS